MLFCKVQRSSFVSVNQTKPYTINCRKEAAQQKSAEIPRNARVTEIFRKRFWGKII
jgi:phosphoglycerate-specific signal transduction histidine kinase